MSELTKRLSDRLRIHYNLTADDIAEEAADRIEALEECLREALDTLKWTAARLEERGLSRREVEYMAVKARALLEEK